MTHPAPREICRDAAEPSSGPDLGPLPDWDLNDLYRGQDDPKLAEDLGWLERQAAAFAADYESKLDGLNGAGIARCVERYERISQLSGRIMSFAGLRHAQNSTDPGRSKFLSDMQGKVTDFSTPLVFFTLEMNRLSEERIEGWYAESAEFARYRPAVRRMRAYRPHQLSDELEKFLHDNSVVGAAAWNRLFDETMAALTFEVEGETLGLEPTLNLLTDTDRTRRQAGGEALAGVFTENLTLFSRITNTLAKEKEIEDRWRNFSTPQASRHLANDVEPEVVQALRDAVVASYPKLSHRYYALKARWLGLDKMQYWDRNAPLPEREERVIPWDEARDTVLSAYEGFSPRMAEIADPFFRSGWIDAGVKPGKVPGAFAHPTVTDVHPYILLNYLGKPRDVMTLAHELGHGVHQVLAAKQGEILSSTPLTLAETASVFGEMLTFRALLDKAPDLKARKTLLAGKVEDMINTVVRQIAFYEFECRVHAARRDGELTPDAINQIWMSVQGESLGPAIEFASGYEVFWSYVPHFIHAPFYVYAYAFGDALVNALYAVYENGDPAFQEKYFEMLSAGGTRHHRELLAPFGLNAADPGFWDHGLGLIGRMIDELESMPD